MATINTYVTTKLIDELARPSNIRYGMAIYKRGGVQVQDSSSTFIEAKVGGLEGSVAEGGSQRRTTRLELKDGKLVWHCTESSRPDLLFCKHCVALALFLLDSKK